jgi:hypothetical protein
MSLALLCLFDAAYILALNQAGVVQSRANQLQQTTIYPEGGVSDHTSRMHAHHARVH